MNARRSEDLLAFTLHQLVAPDDGPERNTLDGETMAEIRVEPQRRSRGWLWLLIIVLIIIAALVWYFMYSGRTSSTASSAPPAATRPATTP